MEGCLLKEMAIKNGAKLDKIAVSKVNEECTESLQRRISKKVSLC